MPPPKFTSIRRGSRLVIFELVNVMEVPNIEIPWLQPNHLGK
jgi:hypothetical protein